MLLYAKLASNRSKRSLLNAFPVIFAQIMISNYLQLWSQNGFNKTACNWPRRQMMSWIVLPSLMRIMRRPLLLLARLHSQCNRHRFCVVHCLDATTLQHPKGSQVVSVWTCICVEFIQTIKIGNEARCVNLLSQLLQHRATSSASVGPSPFLPTSILLQQHQVSPLLQLRVFRRQLFPMLLKFRLRLQVSSPTLIFQLRLRFDIRLFHLFW